jgi:hypothetical protein
VGREEGNPATSLDATLASPTTNVLGLQGIVKNAAIFPDLHVRSALTTIFSWDVARFRHDFSRWRYLT